LDESYFDVTFGYIFLVAMVMLIMNDIKYFLFVLVCVLIGFAQGFWLLLNNADPETDFSSVRRSYFGTFMFMLGNIDQEQIDNSKSSGFTKVFLVAFMITMLILFFNLLIALMGDSFDRTKKHIEAHYWRELASFLVDQSMPTPFIFLLQLTGAMVYEKDDFVHVIKYASDVKLSGSNFHTTRRGDVDVRQNGCDGEEPDVSPLEKAFNVSAKLVKSNISERQQLKLSKKSFVDDDIIDRKDVRKREPPKPTIVEQIIKYFENVKAPTLAEIRDHGNVALTTCTRYSNQVRSYLNQDQQRNPPDNTNVSSDTDSSKNGGNVMDNSNVVTDASSSTTTDNSPRGNGGDVANNNNVSNIGSTSEDERKDDDASSGRPIGTV
jgi:hypothetical protein